MQELSRHKFKERLAIGKEEREALVRSTVVKSFALANQKAVMEEASVEEDIAQGVDAYLGFEHDSCRYKSQIKSRDPKTGTDLLQDLFENRNQIGWEIGRDHPDKCAVSYIFLLNAEQTEICIFNGKKIKTMLRELLEEWEESKRLDLMYSRKHARCQVRKWLDPKSQTPKIGAFIPRMYATRRIPVIKEKP